MKKVLFATTALVATAGFAAADVSLSGSAEMGIATQVPSAGERTFTITEGGVFAITDFINGIGPEPDGPTIGVASDDEVGFHTDVFVDFVLTGETDNGLTFGASIGLEEAAGGVATNVEDDFDVFISGGFGTISMGDTDGAFDWAMSELDLAAGSITDNHTAHAGFQGNAGLDGYYDGQILRYEYLMDGFGAAVSIELDDGSDDYVFGIGARYSGEVGGGLTLGAGIGYQETSGSDDVLEVSSAVTQANPVTDTVTISSDDASIWGMSLTAAHDSGFSAGINYSHLDIDNLTITTCEDVRGATCALSATAALGGHERTFMSIGVGYEFDAVALTANYGTVESDGAADIFDATGWGFAAEYDLGGGASVQFGYGHSDYDIGGVFNQYSLGLAMSF